MKRQEVIDKWEQMKVGGGESFKDGLVAYAKALGVVVEADEVPLPELEFGDDGQVWVAGKKDNGYVLRIVNTASNPNLGRKLMAAIKEAYNDRPVWRTGKPKNSGWYAIKGGPCGVSGVAYFDGVSFSFNEMPRNVVSWCELPE